MLCEWSFFVLPFSKNENKVLKKVRLSDKVSRGAVPHWSFTIQTIKIGMEQQNQNLWFVIMGYAWVQLWTCASNWEFIGGNYTWQSLNMLRCFVAPHVTQRPTGEPLKNQHFPTCKPLPTIATCPIPLPFIAVAMVAMCRSIWRPNDRNLGGDHDLFALSFFFYFLSFSKAENPLRREMFDRDEAARKATWAAECVRNYQYQTDQGRVQTNIFKSF